MSDQARLAVPSQPPVAAPRGEEPTPSRVSSETLLGASGVLVIEHAGREYRLRLTQNGKLILTA